MNKKRMNKKTRTARLSAEFSWDAKDLGEAWMNSDKMETLLYSDTSTTRDLLEVTVSEDGIPESMSIDECLRHLIACSDMVEVVCALDFIAREKGQELVLHEGRRVMLYPYPDVSE